MSVRALTSILHINYDSVTEEMYRQITMPCRYGGLGIINWAEHAPVAYEASIAGESKNQREDDPNAPSKDELRESQFWELEMQRLKEDHPTLSKHLEKHSTKMANGWLQAPLTPLSAHTNNEFCAAMIHRLGFAGRAPDAVTNFKCKCGFPTHGTQSSTTTRRDVIKHMLGCTVNGAASRRHHKIRDALMRQMTMAGYTCTPEDPLDSTRTRLMDIVAVRPNGKSKFIDITVINPDCRSNAGKSFAQLVAAKHAEKASKYQSFADAQGFEYMTFAIDIYGKMTEESFKFLQELNGEMKPRFTNPADQHMLTFAATIAPISRALMFGNGMCLSLCDGLHNLGIRFGNPPVAVVAPQPRARSDDDNARVEIVAEVATVAAAAVAAAVPTVEADDI